MILLKTAKMVSTHANAMYHMCFLSEDPMFALFRLKFHYFIVSV